MSGFAVRKALSHSTILFWKKNHSSLFVQIKNGVQIFLKINGSRYSSPLVILQFQKIFLHNKIINNMQATKNQGSSTYHFGENYLTNHLIKFYAR